MIGHLKNKKALIILLLLLFLCSCNTQTNTTDNVENRTSDIGHNKSKIIQEYEGPFGLDIPVEYVGEYQFINGFLPQDAYRLVALYLRPEISNVLEHNGAYFYEVSQDYEMYNDIPCYRVALLEKYEEQYAKIEDYKVCSDGNIIRGDEVILSLPKIPIIADESILSDISEEGLSCYDAYELLSLKAYAYEDFTPLDDYYNCEIDNVVALRDLSYLYQGVVVLEDVEYYNFSLCENYNSNDFKILYEYLIDQHGNVLNKVEYGDRYIYDELWVNNYSENEDNYINNETTALSDKLIDILGDKMEQKSLLETGEVIIGGKIFKTYSLGSNTPEKFTAQEHFAINEDGEVYYIDVLQGADWIPYNLDKTPADDNFIDNADTHPDILKIKDINYDNMPTFSTQNDVTKFIIHNFLNNQFECEFFLHKDICTEFDITTNEGAGFSILESACHTAMSYYLYGAYNVKTMMTEDIGEKDKVYAKIEVTYNNEDYDLEAYKKAKEFVIKNPVPKSGFNDFESEKEYALKIHDFIAKKVTYSSIGYKSFYDRLGLNHYDDCQEAYNVLGAEQDEAVCAAYARAFALVAQTAGINAAWIYGNETEDNSHAWNIIYPCDGSEPVLIDVTWDDTMGDDRIGQQTVSNKYFYVRLSEETEHTMADSFYEFISFINEDYKNGGRDS